MPLVNKTANFNIRRPSGPSRQETWFSVAGPTFAASPIAMSATGTFLVTGASTSSFMESINSLKTYNKVDGYGRDASIVIVATAFLELETFPLDNQSAFVMIKRVSPIMPSPSPLDSKGRPT